MTGLSITDKPSFPGIIFRSGVKIHNSEWALDLCICSSWCSSTLNSTEPGHAESSTCDSCLPCWTVFNWSQVEGFVLWQNKSPGPERYHILYVLSNHCRASGRVAALSPRLKLQVYGPTAWGKNRLATACESVWPCRLCLYSLARKGRWDGESNRMMTERCLGFQRGARASASASAKNPPWLWALCLKRRR